MNMRILRLVCVNICHILEEKMDPWLDSGYDEKQFNSEMKQSSGYESSAKTHGHTKLKLRDCSAYDLEGNSGGKKKKKKREDENKMKTKWGEKRAEVYRIGEKGEKRKRGQQRSTAAPVKNRWASFFF